jgi:D-alanyl-D-alanine dipeptidase
MPKRPYHDVSINECQEPLIEIPLDKFAVETPHPYQKLGAPYGEHSPYFVRESVVKKIIKAQEYLQNQYPGWKIQIFDAYRPVAVQQFMVDFSFSQAVAAKNLVETELSTIQHQEIWEQVYQIWAAPSLDMQTPPPHSTGAAVDITLVDASGKPIDMGSPIDEMSDRSLPDYYLNHSHPQAQIYHANRQILRRAMYKAGFCRNPKEWWHFSYGDQMWAWLYNLANPENPVQACYGRLL